MVVGTIKKFMLQKESKLRPCDNAGVRWVKCVRVIGKSKSFGYVGELLAVVIQKFKLKKKLVKKKIYYGLVISMKTPLYRKDGIIIRSDLNRMVLLSSENLQFLGTRIYGPIYKEIVNITDKKKKKTQKYAKVVSYAGGII
jgi:large subunit ribosomal protein L14